MATTATPFQWPAGPKSVEVSGDWDQWKEKVSLERQSDGSFASQIPLPSDTKVHYKFIVDGNWTTNAQSPIVNDAGNQNNVVDVGPAPSAAQAVSTKAGEVGAGVAAGLAGAATATGVAASKFVDHVNGSESPQKGEAVKELSERDKKADPAVQIRKTADDDLRNHIPTSLTTATHAAAPVLASAVATVTGADILRGNPEALPVSEKEKVETQAQAMKGDNAFLADRLEPQGGAVSDPRAAVTENSKAAASVAQNATPGAPVSVTHNGFAANVSAGSGGLSTAADNGKEGGEKAGAVAAASSGAVAATAAGVGAGALAASNKGKEEKPSEGASAVDKAESKLPSTGEAESKAAADKASAPAAASSGPLATGKETTTPTATATKAEAASGGKTASTGLAAAPSTGGVGSKAAADKATAPAAASSGPLATGKETTTPAAIAKKTEPASDAKVPSTGLAASEVGKTSQVGAAAVPAPAVGQEKSLPVTPTKKKEEQGAKAVPAKGDTVKGSRFSTIGGSRRKNSSADLDAAAKDAGASASDSPSATPDRKRKQSIFGKIKNALSSHSSPSK